MLNMGNNIKASKIPDERDKTTPTDCFIEIKNDVCNSKYLRLAISMPYHGAFVVIQDNDVEVMADMIEFEIPIWPAAFAP
jgi:hypothetical protein